MTTDDRALREAQDLARQQFLSSDFELIDSSYNIDSAVSVYVYNWLDEQCGSAVYIINDRGLYYSVYLCLGALMKEILNNDSSEREYDLTPEEMRKVDSDIDLPINPQQSIIDRGIV